MSSFSDLLGQFQKSAQTLSAAQSKQSQKKTKNDQQSQQQVKRKHDDDSSLYGTTNKKWANNNNKKRKVPSDLRGFNIHFLCIGAQKAGTTWLHELLKLHPQFNLPLLNQKELHFWDWNRHKGLSWYRQQFHHPPPTTDNKQQELQCGEITPCYAVLPLDDIQEIYTLFPKCKVIFLARSLIDRAWSALLMELRHAVCGIERGTFMNHKNNNNDNTRRMEQKANPDKYTDDYFMERLQHSTHTLRSSYAKCIQNWLQYFPKEQLLIVPYTQISKQPRQTLIQISNFILDHNNDNNNFYSTVEESKLYEKFNDAASSYKKKNNIMTIRPSLRHKMQQYLKPLTQEFNILLKDLGYDWQLEE